MDRLPSIPVVRGRLVEKLLSDHTDTRTRTEQIALPWPPNWSATSCFCRATLC